MDGCILYYFFCINGPNLIGPINYGIKNLMIWHNMHLCTINFVSYSRALVCNRSLDWYSPVKNDVWEYYIQLHCIYVVIPLYTWILHTSSVLMYCGVTWLRYLLMLHFNQFLYNNAVHKMYVRVKHVSIN